MVRKNHVAWKLVEQVSRPESLSKVMGLLTARGMTGSMDAFHVPCGQSNKSAPIQVRVGRNEQRAFNDCRKLRQGLAIARTAVELDGALRLVTRRKCSFFTGPCRKSCRRDYELCGITKIEKPVLLIAWRALRRVPLRNLES